jgi:hypothetical protein
MNQSQRVYYLREECRTRQGLPLTELKEMGILSFEDRTTAFTEHTERRGSPSDDPRP